eukprot:maker-scaffold_11-snap-gene-5.13-mRNA-1 protein AED:0.00 eAED:0.00 QI:172/1/1/1/0.4/0.33/6/58/513
MKIVGKVISKKRTSTHTWDETEVNEANVEKNVSDVTINDLTIDLSIDPLERILKYTKSKMEILRYAHVKKIYFVVSKVGFERTSDKICHLLKTLSGDEQIAIRLQVAVEIRHLLLLLKKEKNEIETTFFLQLLEIIQHLLDDADKRVELEAYRAIVSIHDKFSDLMTELLPIVLFFAHKDDVKKKILALKMMNAFAVTFYGDLFSQFILPELINFCEDENYRVRKSVCSHLSNILLVASSLNRAYLDTILSQFSQLSRDPLWAVRRSCAENLAKISIILNKKERKEFCLPHCQRLVSDDNPHVSMTCNLNAFLSTLEIDDVPVSLLQHSLVFQDTKSNGLVEMYVSKCIVSLFKMCNYSSMLEEAKKCFVYLISMAKKEVNLLICSQLPSLFSFFEDEKGMNTLYTYYADLLDTEFDAQISCLRCFYALFCWLNEEYKLKLLNEAEQFLTLHNLVNWRVKISLAKQLQLCLAYLTETEDTKFKECIFSILLILSTDQNTTVQKEALFLSSART